MILEMKCRMMLIGRILDDGKHHITFGSLKRLVVMLSKSETCMKLSQEGFHIKI